MTKGKNKLIWNIILILTAIFALASIAILTSGFISHKQEEAAATEPPAPTEAPGYTIMVSFDSLMEKSLTESHEAAVNVKKAFWIPDNAGIAPKPNESCYGQADDPASLQWLLDKASEILDGQE